MRSQGGLRGPRPSPARPGLTLARIPIWGRWGLGKMASRASFSGRVRRNRRRSWFLFGNGKKAAGGGKIFPRQPSCV